MKFRAFALFAEQKKILSNKLNAWVGEASQIDDILVVGTKVDRKVSS
jgi:hypothetical protein